MKDTGFIFQPWETRVPYYALMKLEEDKVCALEMTWGAARSKGIRVALATTFGAGWRSVVKEAGKQSLKQGGRKALGCATGLVCGYFGTAAVVLVTKSAKIIKGVKVCHSVCSGGLDVAELCFSAPIHVVEIGIFGRPVILDESNGFDLFSNGPSDPIADTEEIVTQIFSKKK